MRLPGVGGRTLGMGMEQKGCRRLVGKDLATRMLTGLGVWGRTSDNRWTPNRVRLLVDDGLELS